MDRFLIEEQVKRLIDNKLIKAITNYNKLIDAIVAQKAVYLGFDPTSDSLHIGHFLPIYLLKQLIKLGCPGIIVIGDFTGAIGDPSFRKRKRQTLEDSELDSNIDKITKQITNFLPNCRIYNNQDWYENWSIRDFLKTLGKAFTVNKMLEKKSLAEAYERQNLLYSEFSYLLLQAYDFYHLYKIASCAIQIGGSDQYPNITLGIDLIKKMLSSKNIVNGAVGLTTSLITRNGVKISKSQSHYLALNLKVSNLHDYYHFFHSLSDDDAKNWAGWLGLPIGKMASAKHNLQNQLQDRVAIKVVNELFGSKKVEKLRELIDVFKPDTPFRQLWTCLRKYLPYQGMSISIDLKVLVLVHAKKVISTRGDFKRHVINKAIKLNETLVTDWNHVLEQTRQNQEFIVYLGKKPILLVEIYGKVNYK